MRTLAKLLLSELPAVAATPLRVLGALLAAPFIVMLPLSLGSGVLRGFMSSLIAAAFMFPVVLVIGLPVYVLLRAKRWLRWHHFAVAGVSAGIALFVVLPSAVSLIAAGDALASWRNTPAVQSLSLIARLLVGASLTGIVIWVLLHSKYGALTHPSSGRPSAAAHVKR